MNKFDEKYDIRLANIDEIPEVMQFINDHWRENHILARDRVFFNYEMVVDGQVNVVIAKDRMTGNIDGMLGFLFASKDKEKRDIWDVVWKVLDKAMPMLGVELKRRRLQISAGRTSLGVGLNPKTAVPISKMFLHHQIQKMKHFYCIADRNEYFIAKIVHKEVFVFDRERKIHIQKINTFHDLMQDFDFSVLEDIIPYKDKWYINRRYYEHPIYRYSVYGLSEADSNISALVIFREQEYNGEKALHIVDYLGNPKLFGGLGFFFEKALTKYEYIDFYFSGFDERYVREAGMVELEEDDTNIIPTYFNPFVQKNVDIWVSSDSADCLFFKADGDQDRPS